MTSFSSCAAARIVSLSVLALLGATSLAQAGFIWLAPDGQPALEEPLHSGIAKEASAEDGTAVTTTSAARPWTLEGLIDQSGAQPPAAVLVPQTLSASPVYASAEPSAVVMPLTPVLPAAQASPQAAPAGFTANQQTETILANSRNVSSSALNSGAGSSAAAAMPNAQSLIDGMPSMTAPRPIQPETSQPVGLPVSSGVVAPSGFGDTSPYTGQSVSPQAQVQSVVSPVAINAPLLSVPQSSMQESQVVEGFGTDMPLSIALHQIVPASFSTMQGEGVDLTRVVSWQGGRPWPQVLADAIRPLGLASSMNGTVVMITRGAAVAAMPNLPASAPRAVLTNSTMMQAIPIGD